MCSAERVASSDLVELGVDQLLIWDLGRCHAELSRLSDRWPSPGMGWGSFRSGYGRLWQTCSQVVNEGIWHRPEVFCHICVNLCWGSTDRVVSFKLSYESSYCDLCRLSFRINAVILIYISLSFSEKQLRVVFGIRPLSGNVIATGWWVV